MGAPAVFEAPREGVVNGRKEGRRGGRRWGPEPALRPLSGDPAGPVSDPTLRIGSERCSTHWAALPVPCGAGAPFVHALLQAPQKQLDPERAPRAPVDDFRLWTRLNLHGRWGGEGARHREAAGPLYLCDLSAQV